ncbi:MAG TPA: glycosyltransferase [Solirubrobacteraceae bacterium]|jgi:glycosyltransferase involved in cell wall biosynthesis
MQAIIPERYRQRLVRALVVSNMLPDERRPERGRFVRDQVAALRRLPGLEVELYEFPPGARNLLGAARGLRRRYRGERLDVVHAHFGLTAWPALAVAARARGLTVHGTDVRHRRTRQVTRAVLPLMELVGAVSPELLGELPGRRARRRAQVLPCGVDLERFGPRPRSEARAALGLDPNQAHVLFPADSARPGKRYDRALALLRALAPERQPRLLTLGGVDPQEVPLWINAANAVLVPSEQEGFGLAALEALACDVPVLATPVGVHPRALGGLAGTLCAPFAIPTWRAALEPHLSAPDPRISGRARAEPFSSAALAIRLASAWRALLEDGDGRAG